MRDEWVDKSCHGIYLEAKLHQRKLAESWGIVNCTKERHTKVIAQKANLNEGDKNNRNYCAFQVQLVLLQIFQFILMRSFFCHNTEANQVKPDSLRLLQTVFLALLLRQTSYTNTSGQKREAPKCACTVFYNHTCLWPDAQVRSGLLCLAGLSCLTISIYVALLHFQRSCHWPSVTSQRVHIPLRR